MPKTWGTSDAGEFVCECGAVYRKRVMRLPVRDKDTRQCSVCNAETDSWNSTTVPMYELIKRPPTQDSSDLT
jgi:hypothetical protein